MKSKYKIKLKIDTVKFKKVKRMVLLKQYYLNTNLKYSADSAISNLLAEVYWMSNNLRLLKAPITIETIYEKERVDNKILINCDASGFIKKKGVFLSMKYLKSKILNKNFFVIHRLLQDYLLYYMKLEVYSLKKQLLVFHNKPYYFLMYKQKRYIKNVICAYICCMNILKNIFFKGYNRWFIRYLFEEFIYKMILKDWNVEIQQNFSLNLLSINKKYLTAIILLKYIRNLLNVRYTLMEVVNLLMIFLQKNKSWIRGVVLRCKGRFTRKERATYNLYKLGKVSFRTLSEPIDYYSMTIILKYGSCNLTLWLSKY